MYRFAKPDKEEHLRTTRQAAPTELSTTTRRFTCFAVMYRKFRMCLQILTLDRLVPCKMMTALLECQQARLV